MARRRRWVWRWSKLDVVWAVGLGIVVARAAFGKHQIDDGVLYVGMVMIGAGLGLRWNGGAP